MIANMGYKTVEFFGYYDIPALEMKTILTETGLKAISSQIFLDQLLSDLYKFIEYSLIVGASYIVVPTVPKEQFTDHEQFQRLVTNLTWVGTELKRHGLQLAYHNHSQEFEKINGQFILERLTSAISPDLLKLEIDIGWMAKAGVNPVTYLPLLKDRLALLHIKTIDREGNFTEFERGVLDLKAIYNVAIMAG